MGDNTPEIPVQGCEPDYQTLFDAAPGLYLVLDPDFRIVAVNNAYARATKTQRRNILGKGIFEVFPDNPDDPGAEGVRNLRASLLHVLQTRQPDAMPIQKYDIPKPAEEGEGFESRYWSPLNMPVMDADGRLAYIIHRVEDVTEFVRLKQLGIEEGKLNDTFRQQALRMETEVFARTQEVAEASARLKNANEELDQLYRKTLELDELKTRFFSNVSHELRTPLTLILGPLASLANSPRLNEAERYSALLMQRNARVLHRQVDNLLDIAKLDAGHMAVHYASFDMASLVRVLASNFDSIAADRQIHYTCDAPSTLVLEADLEKCERILLNLLSNAFKFTPDAGSIHVSLGLGGAAVTLSVRDSGPGIPEGMREAIFERFRQIDDGPERQVGGSGLGLSIVREFSVLHKGSAWIETAQEGGAAVRVSLPLKAPLGVEVSQVSAAASHGQHFLVAEIEEVAQVARNRLPPQRENRDAPLVLVIEDNADMNAFISSSLERRYRVANAFDGNAGLALATSLNPALILSDVMMPGMSGDRLVARIRQYRELDDTPIVMLTAKIDEALQARLLSHGVQDYIQKPFSTDELLARVAGLINERTRVGLRIRSLEERFRATFEQAAVGIAHVAPDGRWLRVNQKLCDIVSYSYEELMPLTFQDITHPDDLEPDIALVDRALSGALDSYELEKRYIRKDGSLVWVKLTVSLVRTDDGRADYFIAVVEDINLRKAAELALRESDERFRLMTETLQEVIWLIEVSPRRFVYVSPAYEKIWQLSCASLYENPLQNINAIDEVDRERIHQIKLDAIAANQAFELEYRIRRPDGSLRWIREHSQPVMTPDGPEGRYVGIAHDITESREIEEKLLLAATVFENAREAVVITTSTGDILAVNDAFREMTGYEISEAIGQNLMMMRSDRHGPEFFQGIWKSLKHTGEWQGEMWNRRKSGALYLSRVTISSVPDAYQLPSRYVALITDISQLHHSEEQLTHLAHYDSLTDLPNRLLLQSRLEYLLTRALYVQGRVGLLCINLDRFQTINESLGHAAGDRLLIAVAQRLRGLVHDEDTFGRLSSDEFMLIVPDLQTPGAVAAIAQEILDTLEQAFSIDGSEDVYIGASIGISISPEDGRSPSDLLRNADAALHRAKEQGRNRFCFYTAAMNATAREKLELDAALRKAAERGEFLLYYQPKVDLRTGEICGAEALIRWQRNGELVPPVRFIPLAEATGLIVPIGTWVIDEACRQVQSWLEQGLPAIRVAVNVSARQFRTGNLPQLVAESLRRYDLAPDSLELELTESMLMEDPLRTIEILHELKRLGVHLSLDDFGTGYSSFTYLSRFPIDALKIDQSFVSSIVTEHESAVIATSIIDLAHGMNLKVIGEGIENAEQLAYLRKKGCDEIQGYFFSKPLMADDFHDLLREGRRLDR